MINEPCFAFIIEKNEIEKKINDLFNYNLNKNLYPDKYIGVLEHTFFGKKGNEIIFNKNNRQKKLADNQFSVMFGGTSDGVSFPGNFTEQIIELKFLKENQGFFGDENTLFFYIEFKNSEFTYQNNNYQPMMLIQKIMEILKPIYGWIIHSEIVKNLPYEVQNLISSKDSPWLYYSPTRYFSNDLLKKLKVSNTIWREKIDQIYRIDFLKEGIWLANCHGLGNELPYRTSFSRRYPRTPEEMEFANSKIGNWQGDLAFWDKNLERILELQSNKHDTLMRGLFGEIRL